MGRDTVIAWSDSTWSPWIGCTEVSTEASGGGGCDHCYARELDARYKYGGATHWGTGVPRHRTSKSYWRQPRIWDRAAKASGKPHRVFPSLCDPFDDEIDIAWRADFFDLIEETLNLTWLLLTKRAGNALKMFPRAWLQAPLHNVWIGGTMVNQREADRDLDKLRAIPAVRRFISHEPALGGVLWPTLEGIDQVIVGGESDQGKHKARPFDVAWAHDTVAQCRAAGVAPFVKQLGSFPVEHREVGTAKGGCHIPIKLNDRAGADPAEWPENIRVQQWPSP